MFTGLRTARRALKLVDDLELRLAKLENAHQHLVSLLEERLTTLEGQHKKLRGRFYAAGLGSEDSAGAAPGTREERRLDAFRKAGYSAGKVIKGVNG